MADDLIQQDQPPEQAPWQAPRVTRFAAGGAGAGDAFFNNVDGDTAKS